jgi:tetratricopeptide (TPR) repeat protein
VIRGGASSSTRDELLTFRRKSAPLGGSDTGGLNLIGFRCAKSLHQEPPAPELSDALTTGPDLADAAEWYCESKMTKLARLCCDRLLALNVRSVDGRFWMARCLHDDHKFAEALACLRTVYFQKPSYQGRQSTVKGLIDDVMNHLAKESRTTPDSSFLEAEKWFAQAQQALDAARYDEAEKLLGRILGWDPENEVAHEQMAMITDKRGNHAATSEHLARRTEGYRRSLREDPDNADLRDQFAEFLLHNALLPIEAKLHARKATELAPLVARYRVVFAKCHAHDLDWDDAVAQLELATELDPADEDARELLASYRSQVNASGSKRSQ